MLCRLGGEVDDSPATVVRILAAGDEPVTLELRRHLARRRERQVERARELPDRLAWAGRDLGQQTHVPASELGLAVDEGGELG